MTDFYTEHYSARIGSTGHFTTLASAPVVLRNFEKRARSRRSSARWIIPAGTNMGNGDVIRCCDLKSSDCPTRILFSCDADFGATTTFHIGLYKKGDHDDGDVIDADLFASTVDMSGAIARTDYFTEAATLADYDRGRPLWYLADLGAGTYSADPGEVWTVAMVTTQDIDVVDAAVSCLLEVYYVSQD